MDSQWHLWETWSSVRRSSTAGRRACLQKWVRCSLQKICFLLGLRNTFDNIHNKSLQQVRDERSVRFYIAMGESIHIQFLRALPSILIDFSTLFGGLEAPTVFYDDEAEPFDDEFEDKEVDFATIEKCSACEQKALFGCNSCQGAPTLEQVSKRADGAWYCSRDCQSAHAPTHKELCQKLQQRIEVCRVGEFLQQVWLIFRRSAFDLDITSVWKHKSRVVMVQGDNAKKMASRWVAPFPKDLTNETALVDAIATYRSCSEATLWLQPLLISLVSGKLMHCTDSP